MNGLPPLTAVLPTDMPHTTVILHIIIERFNEKAILPYRNPMCVVFEQRLVDGIDDCEWHEIGRTEITVYEKYPAFETPIYTEYIRGIEQIIRVDINNIFEPKYGRGEERYVGSVEFPLSKVLSSPGGVSHEEVIVQRNPEQHVNITVSAEEVNISEGVCFSLAGRHLDKKDLFGKSDPYIKIVREIGGRRVTVHKTEPIHQTLDPTWSEFTINVGELCGCKYDEKIIFECWDWDQASSDDFIGECSISFNEIQQKTGPFSLPLIDPKKLKKKSYKDSGELVFNSYSMVHYYSFNDYVIGGGCELNLITAIDFSSGNFDPENGGSLLHDLSDSPNSYERSMKAMCDAFLPYNHSKTVPLYGFGGLPSSCEGQDPQCFALNGNSAHPEVNGVEEMISTYRSAVSKYRIGNSTTIAPVIKQAMKIVEANSGPAGSRYFVLLIMATSYITNSKGLMSAITQAASNLPMSIVIVGVGKVFFLITSFLATMKNVPVAMINTCSPFVILFDSLLFYALKTNQMNLHMRYLLIFHPNSVLS